MRRIDMEQVRLQLEELLDIVNQGEEVIITKDEQPLAKLIALPKKPKRQFGSAKGLIQLQDDFDEPLEDFKEYM